MMGGIGGAEILVLAFVLLLIVLVLAIGYVVRLLLRRAADRKRNQTDAPGPPAGP